MSTYTFARFPNTHTVHIVADANFVLLHCAEASRRETDPVILSASEAADVSAIEICPNCEKKAGPPKLLPQLRTGLWRSEPATQMQLGMLRERFCLPVASLQGMTRGEAADIINPPASAVGSLQLDTKSTKGGAKA